ncbi:phosphate acyltransferase [Calditrichota bacterium]
MSTNKKHKILIVEDNQENIDLLYYFLSPQGYEITAVNDGLEAIKAVESDKPDIILLDIMMPKLDGYQVCERLKKNNVTKTIPIIMITALKELKDKIRSLEAGADDFITKPFENVELLARVKSLLRLKEYHDEIEKKNLQLEKKNESLLRMDRFREDLINLIVHDMKNPLFVIQGNLQMMAMGMDKNAIIDGPLALDNALSKQSCQVKNLNTPVGGDADILIVPNIETGNACYKLLTILGNAKVAGIIVGAAAPIVLTSRADSDESKFLSIVTALKAS